MDPHLAQQMFEEFGTLVLTGMPPGTEFGIDLTSWNVGERFKGVKMIPPGLHFIYFSAVSRQGDTAPRTGFFHVFRQRDLVVRHYNAATEDLEEEEASNPEEEERIRLDLRNLDRHLGPYPMELWEKWISLTQYITEDDLERMVPISRRICSVPELMVIPQLEKPDPSSSTSTSSSHPLPQRTNLKRDAVSNVGGSPPENPGGGGEAYDSFPPDSEAIKPGVNASASCTSSMPEMVPRPGTELRFCQFPSRPYRDGATPAEITQYSLDSSYSLRKVIGTLGRTESLLAELQFSFVSFLAAQVWDGWEHWRRLLTSLCSAEELLLEEHTVFLQLLSVIHFQVQEVPEDLFVDIVESSNFMAAALGLLFANVNDNSAALPSALVAKAQRFKRHLRIKLGWNLTLEDEGEDAPVVLLQTEGGG